MKHFLKVLVGGLVGTLAVSYLLKLGKRQVRPDLGESRTAGLDLIERGVPETEAALEDTRHRAEEWDKHLKLQLAIARLKAFLFAIRKNRRLAR